MMRILCYTLLIIFTTVSTTPTPIHSETSKPIPTIESVDRLDEVIEKIEKMKKGYKERQKQKRRDRMVVCGTTCEA